MDLKIKIYASVLFLLALVFASVLFIYYSQDSEASYDIAESLSVDDIEFSYRTRSNVSYLTRIQGNFGEVRLVNNGYFKKGFVVDDIIACVDYVNLEDRNVFEGFRLTFDDVYFVRDEMVIPLDFDYSMNVREDAFWNTSPRGFYLYSIPKDNFESLEGLQGLDFERGRYKCGSIGNFVEPLAFIQFAI